MRRYTELVSKNATPVTNLENAKTQAAMFTAAKIADQATLQNLKVQLSYATITRADHRTHQRRRGEGRQLRAVG